MVDHSPWASYEDQRGLELAANFGPTKAWRIWCAGCCPPSYVCWFTNPMNTGIYGYQIGSIYHKLQNSATEILCNWSRFLGGPFPVKLQCKVHQHPRIIRFQHQHPRGSDSVDQRKWGPKHIKDWDHTTGISTNSCCVASGHQPKWWFMSCICVFKCNGDSPHPSLLAYWNVIVHNWNALNRFVDSLTILCTYFLLWLLVSTHPHNAFANWDSSQTGAEHWTSMKALTRFFLVVPHFCGLSSKFCSQTVHEKHQNFKSQLCGHSICKLLSIK